MLRIFIGGILMLAANASSARAQLPLQVSVNAGLAVPVGNEADVYDNGIHVGVGLKAPLIPLQLEASYDKLGAKDANEDLTALSAGVAVPFGITPPLLPVGLYAVLGGGIVHHRAETSATDFGINGGLGVRAGIPGVLSLFGEARGVSVLDEVSRRTYVTASVGVRF